MENLIVDWSENMTLEELKYKENGFIKTKGSVFIDPPSNIELIEAFNKIDVDKTLSRGAIALTKHSHRNIIYPKMIGNDTNKNDIAKKFINDFFKKEICWKNIHSIDNNTIIYEIRNKTYHGMRWYINNYMFDHSHNIWCRHFTSNTDIIFRGILEPYSTYLEYTKQILK